MFGFVSLRWVVILLRVASWILSFAVHANGEKKATDNILSSRWHRDRGMRLAGKGAPGEDFVAHFHRAIFPSIGEGEDALMADVPEALDFSNLAVSYMRSGELDLAARYLTVGLSMEPFGFTLRNNWKDLQRLDSTFRLCPWKRNLWEAGRLTGGSGNNNREGETMFHFLKQLNPPTTTAHQNLGVGLYRATLPLQSLLQSSRSEQQRAELHEYLTILSKWGLYHFEQVQLRDKLFPDNKPIVDFFKRHYAPSQRPRKSDYSVRLCRKSRGYSKATDYFVEGMTLLNFVNTRNTKAARYYLKRAHELSPQDTVASVAYALSLARSINEFPDDGTKDDNAVFEEALRVLHVALADRSPELELVVQYAEKLRAFLREKIALLNVAVTDGGVVEMVVEVSPGRATTPTAETSTREQRLASFSATFETLEDERVVYPQPTGESQMAKNAWARWRVEYLKRHVRAIDAVRNGKLLLKDARFIVCVVPDVGFGNQAASIVSSLLLSMLTNRTLLIHFPPGLEHSWSVLREHVTFPLSEWTEWIYEDVVGAFDSQAVLRSSQSVLLHEETEKSDAMAWESLLCSEDLSAYMESPFVYFSSNLHFFRLIETNPHYADKLAAVFRGDVFGHIARFLIRPTDPVAEAASTFVREHFPGRSFRLPQDTDRSTPSRPASGGSLVVGVHLRTGMDSNERDRAILFTHDRNAVLRAALRCLPGLVERESSVTLEDDDEIESFREVVVFVACDNAHIRQEAIEQIESLDVVSKAIAFSPSAEASRGKTGMYFALVDLFLLSQSDVILRAGKITSMFTTLAAGLNVRGSSQPVYMSPVTTPTFIQCDIRGLKNTCGVELSRNLPKMGVVESVLEGHGDAVGKCFGGVVEAAAHLRRKGALYPHCEELLSMDDRAAWLGNEKKVTWGAVEREGPISGFLGAAWGILGF